MVDLDPVLQSIVYCPPSITLCISTTGTGTAPSNPKSIRADIIFLVHKRRTCWRVRPGVETIRPTLDAARTGDDVSGDARLMAAFVRAVQDPSCAVTTAAESLESHLMAFAAEDARVHDCVVDVDALRRKAEGM
jgi:hypothetical protein